MMRSAVENQGKILEKGLGTGKSLERSNYIDTNNNSADFSINESLSPKNSLSQEFIYNTQGDNEDNDGEESATSTEQTNNSNSNQNISGGGSSSPPPLCSQNNLTVPVYSPVIINEVAWMGSQAGYMKEWIELKNISNSAVNLNSWQLLDKDEQIKIIFSANHIVPANGFYLLERNNDETVTNITADIIYNGTLANDNESLRLFNGNCVLVDEVVANTVWPAGDNNTKQTMERGADLSWHNYSGQGTNGIMGTPKTENSEVSSEQQDENNNENQGEDGEGEQNNEEENNGNEGGENLISGLVITEVMAAGDEEFVEIYNPLEQEIFLTDYYFSYFSSGRDWNNPFLNKKFSTSTPSMPAKTYIVIGLGDYSEEESDWKPYQTHLSDDNGAVALFSCDPGQATTTQEAIDCKIDAVGWGQPLVYETKAATSSIDKSLARKLSPDENGYLRYADTDNNNQDFEDQDPTPGQQNFSPYSDLDSDGIINEYDPLTEISKDKTLPAGEYIFRDLAVLQGFKL
ncbi:MAG: lamin tail domain-containing protein, partial [Candidatus Parcubacteria bacterium]|nr:lamin tail domain-containing protein [Candidatus Parcubacteria bacterium]